MKKIKNSVYPVPALVWSYNLKDTHELRVHAYTEWKGRETKLFKAPFFNTSDNGVCMGTAGRQQLIKIDSNDIEAIMHNVEYAFYHTSFTHGSGDVTVTPLQKLYPTLLGKTEFPIEELIAIKKFTVNDLI